MKAQAHGALAHEVHLSPFQAGRYAADSASETSLPIGARLRATALGALLALVAFVVVTAAALAIVTGPFHTSLGSL